MTTPSKRAIGIDLGTTSSCVGVIQGDKISIIRIDRKPTTPSYVAFTDSEILVGEAAKAQASFNPLNTVFSSKRLIGRRITDKDLLHDLKHWPFQVVEDGGVPKVEVTYKGEKRRYHPEQISAMILQKLKLAAENFMGEPVTQAVITVPAYFNDAQRQATKDAGKIAGLDVLRVLNEPSAAAITYSLDNKCDDEQHIMVFDLGGGTFDVSLLYRVDEFLEVKATCGDTHLGGEDFDNNLVSFLIEEFKRLHQKDISTNQLAIRRLRTACEEAKILLSTASHTSIQREALFEDIDFEYPLSRANFEELNEDLFSKILGLVEQVIKDAEILKSEVTEVVLVGGSTRIPKIQQLLSGFFGGKKLNNSIDPDEAVAYGAAVQAAYLTKTGGELKVFPLVDVNPLSLGIEINGGFMDIVIKRNTLIPVSSIKEYSTSKDNQTSLKFNIYEGERSICKFNNLLGNFKLIGLPNAPRGKLQIKVCFTVDKNGILAVGATEKSSRKHVTIIKDQGRLSDEDIIRMVQKAEDDNSIEHSSDEQDVEIITKDQGKLSDEVTNRMVQESEDEKDTTEEMIDISMYLNRFVLRLENRLLENKETPTLTKKHLEKLEDLLRGAHEMAANTDTKQVMAFLLVAHDKKDEIISKYTVNNLQSSENRNKNP